MKEEEWGTGLIYNMAVCGWGYLLHVAIVVVVVTYFTDIFTFALHHLPVGIIIVNHILLSVFGL